MTHERPLANTFTLGVRDFDAQRGFYRRVGWPQVFDSEDFAVFDLRGALLALFPVDKLAADGHSRPEFGGGGIRFSVIIKVDEPADVDALARDAYFCDPEGNFWEVAWAPPDNPVAAAARRAAGLAA